MESNSKDRQLYQLHKEGYDKIAQAANKGISINVNGQKVKEVKFETSKGDPGAPGKDGKTPVKGVDYFTKAEIREITDNILSQIPIPKDGKDGIVDYKKVLDFVKREVSKIKIPKPVDGKDAVVDYAPIINSVLKQIPVPKEHPVDYDTIKKYIEGEVEKTRMTGRGLLNSGGPTTRLGELVDVNVEGAVNGSVLKFNGSNWVTGEDAGGTVDSVNGQTGVVTLDADDIDDTSTTHKFVTAGDITKLGNLSGTNTGDQTSIVGITGTTAQFNTANTDGDFATLAGTETFTNKRITKRVTTTTDDATAVINIDTCDIYQLSAIANATEFSTTGTPTDGQTLLIRFKDAGAGKALTWTGFTVIGVTLPTTTVAGKWHYVGCQYNSAASAWHVLAVGQEA